MPNRPPIRRPRISEPPNPLNRPGRCWLTVCGWRVAVFGVGVIERSTGPVGFGAVRVGAGACQVRVPRLPNEPPRRASAKSVETSVRPTKRLMKRATKRMRPKRTM